MSPFEALYGRPPPSIINYVAGTSKVALLDEILISRDMLLKRLRENIQHAQHRMQQQVNKHRTDVEFPVDSWVYVKLQPYRQRSLRKGTSHKLAMRYYGPFRVMERIGRVTYKLELPPTARLHNVFHVSKLKLCRNTPPQQTVALPEYFRDNHPLHSPEKVLGFRTLLAQGRPVRQVLVQWQGQDSTDATWEDVTDLQREFPSFRLEDDVVADGGGNDASTPELPRPARQWIQSTRYPSAIFSSH
ncbi:unnamed protein product [Rhodiola kirilowii]